MIDNDREHENSLQSLIDEKAWSKSKMAREAGVAVNTINRMLNGDPTRRDRKMAVAQALGKNIDEVFPFLKK